MTEDEIVELGVRSEALLASKTLKFVVDWLANGYVNNILQSDPSDEAVREQNYLHHRALNDLVSQMGAFVQAKDDIMTQRQSQQDEEDA